MNVEWSQDDYHDDSPLFTESESHRTTTLTDSDADADAESDTPLMELSIRERKLLSASRALDATLSRYTK